MLKHTRAIKSHFTSWVYERTGIYDVRNAVGTLERCNRVLEIGGVVKTRTVQMKQLDDYII